MVDERRNELNGLCSWWNEYYEHLITYLLSSALFIHEYRELGDSFPPNEEAQKIVREELIDKTDGLLDSQINGYFEALGQEGLHKIIDEKIIHLQKLKVKEEESLNKIINLCIDAKSLCDYILTSDDTADPKKISNFVQSLGMETVTKANQLIGYWIAKMEEKMRNQKSASVKTTKKENNKDIIKRLLDKNGWNITKDLIREGQRITDRGERSVKNMIKDIEKEKNS
ncbi:hypothetical protein ACFLZT_00465 [Thermodesulfobacteriota bacterium]